MRVHFSGIGPVADLQRFRRVLSNAGVTASGDHEANITCPALVYFTDTSPELAATVRAMSKGGAARVLAVAGPDAVPGDDLAWRLVHAGASDVLVWDRCSDPVQAIVARLERWRQVDDLIASDSVRGKLIGTGPNWIRLLRQIVEVARFTRASTLITGESGTGKELVARLIHQLDSRPDKGDLVVLDCATVVPTLFRV